MALRGCPSTVVSSVTQRCTSKALLGTPVLGRVSSSTSVARVPAAGRRQQGWNSSRRVHMQAMEGSNKNYPKGIEDIGVNLLTAPKLLLTEAERVRLDEAPDSVFYATPRMMQHAAAEDLEALAAVYRNTLPEGAAVLELCASRYSHLPEGLKLCSMIGQGMNEQELAANTELTEWFVQDLNRQPLLLEQIDRSYDAVLCVNGIQYLTQPELVISEACRVLRPGGFMLIAFGPDFFQQKATAGWINRSPAERCGIIARIMKANGFDQVLTKGKAGRDVADPAQEAGFSILLGTKPANPRGLGDQHPASDLHADNVAEWFTKPGLVGLTEWSASGPQDLQSLLQLHSSEAHLLESWRISYEVLVSDAVSLGIPRSVIPTLKEGASAQQIQAAVQHLQDMVASFMSSGL